jgi:crossover junction endodeoxyribonuclease RusA
MIRFDVLGTPAPKGSGRAMLIRGRARFVAGGSSVNAAKMKSFEAAIRERVGELLGERTEPCFVDRPLVVGIVFRLQRPAGHWGTGKHAGALKPSAPALPTTKPDCDKLCRHVLDVLTGSIWDDDSRIVEIVARKEYAKPGNEGASICVDEWQQPSLAL